MSKAYSIKADRKYTELAIANHIINEPTFVQDFDLSHLKLELVRRIYNFITASAKRGDALSLSVIKNHLKASVGDNVSPETLETIEEICLEKDCTLDDFRSVREHLYLISARENVIRLGENISERARRGENLEEVCCVAESITETKNILRKKTPIISIGQSMDETINGMSEARKNGHKRKSFPFHINGLNKLIGGMYPTDLIVVAARPSVGKTAFGVNTIFHQEEASYGFISSEMSNDQLNKRLIATDTGIDSKKLRSPELMSEHEFSEACISASKFKGRRIYPEDKGGIDIGEIYERITEWVHIHGVNVVFIDYIQRLNSDRRHNNKAEEYGYITKRLKEAAKEFGICVVALAQINRESQKDNRPPTMADIKASGDIEQEADIIILLHKDSMGTDDANFDCIIEAIVAKHRHGSIGTALMVFQPSIVNFRDASNDEIDDYLVNQAA
ncbi:DnaB-like helicase C-terminal domain-containing protein [Vibrio sp. D431a]|uniref:DnaB-like helicase C-terminal domain-containing protein n=1 Tax=Vibrio sp. D431a TaxID=2837388 RepID=UPI0025548D3F|nr:DnaB-like helicase C-terminal domain-containing protein [Vibrio sp. D431a]MDK9793830.1 AAA family ATPase [Vibrio sp. D431a]